MADIIDKSNDNESLIVEATIANRVRYVGESALQCVKCGESIPQRRREAVQGVKLCVECAE